MIKDLGNYSGGLGTCGASLRFSVDVEGAGRPAPSTSTENGWRSAAGTEESGPFLNSYETSKIYAKLATLREIVYPVDDEHVVARLKISTVH